MSKQKIIIVLGPTASGKSSLALKLAKEFNGYLLSADSRQVYQFMNIGTNKDTSELKDGQHFVEDIPEYMIDIVKPDESFSLDSWLKQVKEIISKNSDRVPIIVGGTGLYISALVNNFDLPGSFDKKLRDKLETQVSEKGVVPLLEKIKKIDPNIEMKIDIANPRRIIRAAEIILQTRKPFNPLSGESEFDFLQIGVNLPRQELYDKIDRRVEQMLDQGLIDEVKVLIKKGYDCQSSAMSGIGYRQICQYLNGEISKDEAIRLIKRDTRRYAKRQVTWFKRDKNIYWSRDYEKVKNLVNKFLK